jgi:peroxiredoxin Q/BCP
MGRVYKGIFRTTFIVDKSGKIAHIFDDVKPDGHAEEVLGVLKGL